MVGRGSRDCEQRRRFGWPNLLRRPSQWVAQVPGKKGTKSAKRRLQKRRKKEHRFAANENYPIAKQWVTTAQDTRRGIGLEDLTGIRARITVQKAQRRRQHSWAFDQLRQLIVYKANRAGVPVAWVNPRNTPRTCPQCGLIDQRYRTTQAAFWCIGCGFAGPRRHHRCGQHCP
ncbi:MAG: hypothetical protein C7B45_07605 [Sulfobacillus acidophilus]|uniref:Cas12f1-like TNB domain-containing protein n=1 Tax=Sulfobacillus acidophilus TaxID=53633 RepID=A0A2T2WJ12_9FIRM|nr:MAG: hypothetical protein C7B45_07605 [Sulfobacillus acidophilus]